MFELIIVIAVFVPSILIFSWQNLDNRIAIVDNFIKQRELTLIKLREVKNKYEARLNILNLGRIVTNVASTAAMLVSNKNTRNVLNVSRTISAVSIPFVQIFLDESSSSEFQGVLEKDHKRKDKLMKMLMKEKNGWETLKEINSSTKKLSLKKKSMKSSSPVDDFIDIFFATHDIYTIWNSQNFTLDDMNHKIEDLEYELRQVKSHRDFLLRGY